MTTGSRINHLGVYTWVQLPPNQINIYAQVYYSDGMAWVGTPCHGNAEWERQWLVRAGSIECGLETLREKTGYPLPPAPEHIILGRTNGPRPAVGQYWGILSSKERARDVAILLNDRRNTSPWYRRDVEDTLYEYGYGELGTGFEETIRPGSPTRWEVAAQREAATLWDKRNARSWVLTPAGAQITNWARPAGARFALWGWCVRILEEALLARQRAGEVSWRASVYSPNYSDAPGADVASIRLRDHDGEEIVLARAIANCDAVPVARNSPVAWITQYSEQYGVASDLAFASVDDIQTAVVMHAGRGDYVREYGGGLALVGDDVIASLYDANAQADWMAEQEAAQTRSDRGRAELVTHADAKKVAAKLT